VCCGVGTELGRVLKLVPAGSDDVRALVQEGPILRSAVAMVPVTTPDSSARTRSGRRKRARRTVARIISGTVSAGGYPPAGLRGRGRRARCAAGLRGGPDRGWPARRSAGPGLPVTSRSARGGPRRRCRGGRAGPGRGGGGAGVFRAQGVVPVAVPVVAVQPGLPCAGAVAVGAGGVRGDQQPPGGGGRRCVPSRSRQRRIDSTANPAVSWPVPVDTQPAFAASS
jgi:hypothetical protein